MKRFVLKCLVLVVILGVGLLAQYARRFFRAQTLMDEQFALSKSQKYLFIGSSQIGCSIIESEKYSDRVLWVSTSGPQFTCMKLLELDRRRQLSSVKVCVVPFTINNVNHNSTKVLKLSLARQLPLCWRYIDLLPISFFQAIEGLVANRSLPFTVSEQPPAGRPSVLTHTKDWILNFPDRENVRDTIFNENMYTDNLGLAKNWRGSTINAYLRMAEVCAHRNIRFVVIAPPCPSFCRDSIPRAGWALYGKMVDELKNHGIEFIDCRRDMSDDLFCDYWHLIELGADDFTKACYRKIGLE